MWKVTYKCTTNTCVVMVMIDDSDDEGKRTYVCLLCLLLPDIPEQLATDNMAPLTIVTFSLQMLLKQIDMFNSAWKNFGEGFCKLYFNITFPMVFT